MSTLAALVSGDIVLDCHLYGGVKTAATSFHEPGSVYCEVPGGAELSRTLLAAAADAKGLIYDEKARAWDKAQEERAVQIADRVMKNEELRNKQKDQEPELTPLKRPDDLDYRRPLQSYAAVLGLGVGGRAVSDPKTADLKQLKEDLPQHLHSFGVWTSYLAKKSSKDPDNTVWRIKEHFGYGPRIPSPKNFAFSRASDLPADPALLLLDDGGILFRHERSQAAWPAFTSENISGQPLIVLKMSAPLCRGDLWPKLLAEEGVPRRLLVVVSADDLRREDVQIRKRLSWEQTAADTVVALHRTPIGKELLQADHVVVNFRSAGALWLHRKTAGAEHTATLIFDPLLLEGDITRDFEGTVYGFQTCFAVAIAHHLLMEAAAGKSDLDKAITTGIVTGLLARRKLLELGHGKVGAGVPGFPFTEVGRVIAGPACGFGTVLVPSLPELLGPCVWSILVSSETHGGATPPLIGLGQLAARFGRSALSHVPSLSKGGLFSVDRTEIESLRTLEGLIREYEDGGPQKKPLSIGVFGPPGAGKSFAVKALAKAILGEKVPFLEFNLSQFNDTTDLVGAFHRVRDEVLKGATPVAFWDEFDSRSFHWLQYLLAPMQDGAFQEGQLTHPIGKCLFIFAGGTADTLDEFGVKRPDERNLKERSELAGSMLAELLESEKSWQAFKLLKGPDFISRLHGHLNVLGPNPKFIDGSPCDDSTYPIRRALMLRSVLGLKDDPKKPDELDMDLGLLYALLSVMKYHHGSRSFEKILLTLAQGKQGKHFHRSALPPDPLLGRETDDDEFHKIMNQRNEFKTHPDLEKMAGAIHQNYRYNARDKGWSIKPEIDKDYEDLSPDAQVANRAAAQRIPDLLALIDLKVIPNDDSSNPDWEERLKAVIIEHRERLAQAEHLGWNAERFANGWTFAKERNDQLKQHNLLVDWAKLSESDKDKDRENMDAIPAILKLAKYKAVPVNE